MGTPEPFFFPGGDRAVLCIHGFTGSPYEVRFLGERLRDAGFTVLGPALPGHESPDALSRVRFWDWISAVEAAVADLEARVGRPVGLAGLSMGGALALHTAARLGPRVGALAAFAAPMYLSPAATAAISLGQKIKLERLLPQIPKLAGSDIGDDEARRENPTLPATPVAALYQLIAFLEKTRSILSEVTQPLLLGHGLRDRTVPPSNLDYIAANVASRALEVYRYPRSRHVITIDFDREEIADAAARFFTKHLGRAANRERGIGNGE
jgi:carboxylesterase